MLVKGIMSQLSGSLAGITGSHNQGGLYLRARAIPTNPNTAAQVSARQATSDLVDAWVNTLTAAQRAAWDLYAANVPLIGPLGDSRNVSGIAMYVRSNQPRLRSGASRIDDGPTIFTQDSFSPITIATDLLAQEVDVTFVNTDGWANEANGHLLIQIGLPQSPAVNFFKGPFRWADNIDGAAVPPASPAAIASPFTMTAGQRIFVRARSTRADGRLSPPSIVSAIAA